MKKSLKPYHAKLKAMFAQHAQSVAESNPPESDPPTETPEPAAVPSDDLKQATEAVARQSGYSQGDKVTGRVTNRQMVNRNFVWATVPDWSEQVKVSVHSQEEWPAGTPIKCEYVYADADGHLVFNTKEHGPKWKRRGGR